MEQLEHTIVHSIMLTRCRFRNIKCFDFEWSCGQNLEHHGTAVANPNKCAPAISCSLHMKFNLGIFARLYVQVGNHRMVSLAIGAGFNSRERVPFPDKLLLTNSSFTWLHFTSRSASASTAKRDLLPSPPSEEWTPDHHCSRPSHNS